MAKEKVKHLSGVFASVFAHAGHIIDSLKRHRGYFSYCPSKVGDRKKLYLWQY